MENSTFTDNKEKPFKIDDLSGVEKLRYLGHIFLFSERFSELDDVIYEKMAQVKIEYEREIEELSNPNSLFSQTFMNLFKKHWHLAKPIMPEIPCVYPTVFDAVPTYSDKWEKYIDKKYLNYLK